MRANLSHMEIQIANLIQARKNSKEMADILGVSVNTLRARRFHLRKKLGLKREKVTLKSTLNQSPFGDLASPIVHLFFSFTLPSNNDDLNANRLVSKSLIRTGSGVFPGGNN